MSYIPSWCKRKYTQGIYSKGLYQNVLKISLVGFTKANCIKSIGREQAIIVGLNPFTQQKAGQPITSLWLWTYGVPYSTCNPLNSTQSKHNTEKNNFYNWTSERQPLLVYCASYRLGLACLYNNHGLLTSQMCSSYYWKQRHCRTWNSEGNKLHDRNRTFARISLYLWCIFLCNIFCFPLHYILLCVSLETSIVHIGFSRAPALIFF